MYRFHPACLSGTTSRCIIFRRENRLRGKSEVVTPSLARLSNGQSSSRNRMRTRKTLARWLASAEAICTMTSTLSQMLPPSIPSQSTFSLPLTKFPRFTPRKSLTSSLREIGATSCEHHWTQSHKILGFEVDSAPPGKTSNPIILTEGVYSVFESRKG